MKKRVPWNKGKTKENDQSLAAMSIKKSQKKGHKHSNETKEKISQSMKGNGGYIENAGRGSKHEYNGLILPSDYHYGVAKILDLENIKWVKSDQSFVYIRNNKVKKCYLDFYLPDYDVYVTVKYYANNEIRRKIKDASKLANIKVIVIDEMLYRRILYSGLSRVLNIYKKD